MALSVRFVDKYLAPFIRQHEYAEIWPAVELANSQLEAKSGPGSDFLGWLDLPEKYDRDEFLRIKQAAAKIQANSDVLVVIGIGGSYLGARAVIEAVKSAQYNVTCKSTPQIFFAGASVSPAALNDIVSLCEGKDFSVNIISKSGTTTEPAVAFRVFRAMLEQKYGKEGAKERIFATTDKTRGTLKELADREGYETFVVPDDVGGRYSVLTAVGMLPLAVAGLDVDELMAGARDAMQALSISNEQNDCLRWAAARNLMYRKGKMIEVLCSYEPDFALMNEWYKQLFGESEGKDQKGIFPASVIFTTDLHSMGQYLQDGSRILFETVLRVKNIRSELAIPGGEEDFDGLGYLAGSNLSHVNDMALQGTILAHTDGGVPVALLETDSFAERDMGYLIYFFEKACAVSGYMLGVNPFNQPGVESYKQNMFALLGKPGFEKEAELLRQRLL